jgi:serine/threonine-protein kinase
MTTRKAQLTIDDILDDAYRMGPVIDYGGYALIYEATRLSDGETVAIKVLRQDATSLDPAAVQRFLREAAVAQRLEHPNIVKVYDFGRSAEGWLYLTMERLRGKRLGDVIHRGPVPEAVIRTILGEILAALVCAHGQHVVHRDLKPDNVFLCRRDPDEAGATEFQTKILDFGLTKGYLESEEMLREQLTSAGKQVGTAGYVAPEVLRGATKLNPRIDLYTVGLLGWEMLAGEPAFTGNDMQRIVKQLSREPEPPDAEMTRSPLYSVVQWLMHREPEKRPASAEEALRALQAVKLV